MVLRERNTFVLRARRGEDERQHALTLNVNLREQDLTHFNGTSDSEGPKAIQRLLEVLDEDEAFQALVREMDDLRQLDQLVKTKAKEGTHTVELPDLSIQWQVAEDPGLPSVLQRVPNNNARPERLQGGFNSGFSSGDGGRYRPLPVRKLVVAAWLYPPHVEIPPTGERIPIDHEGTRDFFSNAEEEDTEQTADEVVK